MLIDVALHHSHEDMRTVATELLTKSNYLRQVIEESDDQYIRLIATQNINDQTKLKALAVDTFENIHIRVAAIRKIRNQHVLKSLFYSSDSRIQRAAIENISNQKLLQQIARESGDPIIRKKAIEKITDKDFLMQLFAIDDSILVQATIIKHITEKQLLLKLKAVANEELSDIFLEQLVKISS